MAVCVVQRQSKINEEEVQIDGHSIGSHSDMIDSDLSMNLEDEIHDI